MGDRFHSSINTSPSKHQFAFSKSSRFPKQKTNTDAFGYHIADTFSPKKGSGPAFGSSEKKLKQPRFNSSDQMSGPDTLDNKGAGFAQTSKFSFGVSRDNMKKLYVDEILKSGRDNKEPGPANYPQSPGFGDKKNNGSLYSFRAKNDPMVPHL